MKERESDPQEKEKNKAPSQKKESETPSNPWENHGKEYFDSRGDRKYYGSSSYGDDK